MARYREALPQLAGSLFLSDSGLETTLLFHEGYDLPHFAAVPLVTEDADDHAVQIGTFAGTEADMVHAMTMTMTSPDEAIGIVQAAWRADMPCAISFTVESDGVLPGGTALGTAIRRVDQATDGSAAYFGVNCAHPTHFGPVLDPAADWAQRLRGVRASASRQSHAELDESEVLDDGDPAELAADDQRLRDTLPGLTVLGGCCGTDLRHIRAIADGVR